MKSYPLAIINTAISGGLLFLYLPTAKHWEWKPPFRATFPVVLFFFLSNVFLTVAPLMPPAPGDRVYVSLPYWVSIFDPSVSLFSSTKALWLHPTASPRRSTRVLRSRCCLLDVLDGLDAAMVELRSPARGRRPGRRRLSRSLQTCASGDKLYTPLTIDGMIRKDYTPELRGIVEVSL